MSFLKGLVAVLLGTTIGGMTALRMGVGPIGAITCGCFGGLVAYLAYDFGRVCEAAPRVWHRVAYRKINISIRGALIGVFWGALGVGLPGLTFALYLFSSIQDVEPEELAIVALLFAAFSTFVGAVIGALLGLCGKWEAIEDLRWAAKYLNPVSAGFWIAVGIVLGIKWLFVTGLPVAGRFVAQLLKEVYSDVRLVTAISAFAGVAIFWSYGSVSGLVSAAILFVLQYAAIHIPLKHYRAAHSHW